MVFTAELLKAAHAHWTGKRSLREATGSYTVESCRRVAVVERTVSSTIVTMDLSHHLVGAALYTLIFQVAAQTGMLSISADQACGGGSLTLTCYQNGTFPALAFDAVVFHKNQDETISRCSVDLGVPCSPTFPGTRACGCVSENLDVKVHKYTISPVSKSDETLWRCTRGAVSATDFRRSEDITPDIAEGATLSSGSLSLVRSGSSLVCSGPTSMGDTTLVITRNDTGVVIGNASSTTLTVPLPTISGTEDVTFICSLGGRGARCSSATPGVVVVASSSGLIARSSQNLYAQDGTYGTLTVARSPQSRVAWSQNGTSSESLVDANTVYVTLSFIADIGKGIIQIITARVGNSLVIFTVVVDVYHPSVPVGLACGMAISVLICIIALVLLVAGGPSSKTSSKGEDSKEEGSNGSGSNSSTPCSRVGIIVFVAFAIVITIGLLLAVAIVFGTHQLSLTNAFMAENIAAWFFFALGLLCLGALIALLIVRCLCQGKVPDSSSGNELEQRGERKAEEPINGQKARGERKAEEPINGQKAPGSGNAPKSDSIYPSLQP